MKKQLKKILMVSLLTLTLFFLASCKKETDYDIVTTLFFQYDITREIVKDKLSVSLITPIGSEIHGYEPTAKDIMKIKNAQLFLYTSDELEVWVKNLIYADLNYLNLSKSYQDLPSDDLALITDNIHYWTDPLVFTHLIMKIYEQIILLDPFNQEFYYTNALGYLNQILAVHHDLESLLLNKHYTIYFYGHNAMENFANRYFLTIKALQDSYKPDSEITFKQLENMQDLIITNNVNFLFTEELIDLKGPNSLKASLLKNHHPIELLELHSYHNITKQQYQKGVRYLDLLTTNYENLKKALS